MKLTEVWYLHYLTGSPTHAGQFHVFTNKSLEFITSQTLRAADLPCCAKGRALQFSLDLFPFLHILKICILYYGFAQEK